MYQERIKRVTAEHDSESLLSQDGDSSQVHEHLSAHAQLLLPQLRTGQGHPRRHAIKACSRDSARGLAQPALARWEVSPGQASCRPRARLGARCGWS